MSNVAKPERLNLLDFVGNTQNCQFTIPVFQRTYVWADDKQVAKLLDDYRYLLNKPKNKHFLGVLMYLSIQERFGFTEYSIIDGQQRMITLYLIFQAIKEHAKETGDFETVEKIESKYQYNLSQIGEYKYRLKPSVTNDKVYEKVIDDNKPSFTSEEMKSSIYLAYQRIKTAIQTLYGKFSLEDMLNALNRMYIVIIPLDKNEDNVQEIYETINSTGMKLSKADLIRNYILMNIESNEQERLFTKYWQPLESTFNNAIKFEGFFRNFMANQTYALPNIEQVYDVFRDWYSGFMNSGMSTEGILKIICRYGYYYYDLFITDECSKFENAIKASIEEFKKSTVEPTAPLLLEIYKLYETRGQDGERLVSAENFSKVIDLLNTYNIRRNICNLRSGVLTRIIPIILKDVMAECDGNYSRIYDSCVKHLVDENKNNASFMPDDIYIKQTVSQINAYSLKSYYKIVLEKIESHNNPAPVDFSKLTIEHLTPQTSTPEWITMLGVPKEEYDYHINRIGNLTFATGKDNSKMKNKPLEYKKAVLAKTNHIKMNLELLKKDEWTAKDIENRTQKIINYICELYPYATVGLGGAVSYKIYYRQNNSNISGEIFEDGKVQIFAGSYFEIDNIPEEVIDMIADDGISNKGNGYILKEDYVFQSIQDTTDILINIKCNPWEEWNDNEGKPLNLKIRKIIQNSINSKKH